MSRTYVVRKNAVVPIVRSIKTSSINPENAAYKNIASLLVLTAQRSSAMRTNGTNGVATSKRTQRRITKTIMINRSQEKQMLISQNQRYFLSLQIEKDCWASYQLR